MTRIILLSSALVLPAAAGAAQTDQKQAYIEQSFAAMDTNRDGRVDMAEYKVFQQARFEKQAKSMDAAFDVMDANKDGSISREEAKVVPEIAKYFDGLDTNKNGALARDEMQAAMVAAQVAQTDAN